MKILLLSRYGPLGASSRIRSYQYLPFLKSHGIDVNVAPLLGDDYIKSLYSGRAKSLLPILGAYFRRLGNVLNSRRFDLVWIEKEIFPWMPALVETLLSKFKIPYAVDYDDAIFHRYDLHHSHMVKLMLGRKIDKVMGNASVVIVGNDYIADQARRAGAHRIEYLPSVIDLEKYSGSHSTRDNTFTIGWIGSPVTERYIQKIAPVLSEVCRRYCARVILVGAQNPQFQDVPVEIHAWSEETQVRDIQSFDVGIMPLPDGPLERGKCGYKLIQYMACGKPVVASPVGINKEIVEHGVNGFLAGSTEEWLEVLTVLCDNPDLRRKMGTAGRKKVEEKYCIQVTAPKLLEIYKRVAQGAKIKRYMKRY